MSTNRIRKKFEALCEEFGAECAHVRSNRHDVWKVTKGDKTVTISTPISPSDNRWEQNARSFLRKVLGEANEKPSGS